MVAISVPERIFCCKAAGPDPLQADTKLHQDPNREVHEALFRSFIAFAVRQETQVEFLEEVNSQRKREAARILAILEGVPNSSIEDLTPQETPPKPKAPVPQVIPPFTQESLKGNPLGPSVPYVIHVTSRVNFGPVYSHRYFMCPWDLEHDWIEVSLIHWFAEGAAFNMKAQKWDIRCEQDEHFFRLTLRPNLGLRPVVALQISGPQSVAEAQDSEIVPGLEGYEDFAIGHVGPTIFDRMQCSPEARNSDL